MHCVGHVASAAQLLPNACMECTSLLAWKDAKLRLALTVCVECKYLLTYTPEHKASANDPMARNTKPMSTPPGDVQVRRVFLIGTPYYTNAYTGFLNGHQYAIALTFSQACPEHVKWGSCKIKEEVVLCDAGLNDVLKYECWSDLENGRHGSMLQCMCKLVVQLLEQKGLRRQPNTESGQHLSSTRFGWTRGKLTSVSVETSAALAVPEKLTKLGAS
eukprot:1162144-Pelagomonas_calceolata.AAC.4